jgi:hypothetical protein
VLLCSVQNNEGTGDIKKHHTENIQNINQTNSHVGYEGWTMSEHMEEALRVWERKTLRVYGLEKGHKWMENLYK